MGDITYNWTNEGWLYVAIVKDLCTKDVVGYAIEDRMTMSRKGNPYDNTPAENFFSCLKCECTNFDHFKNRYEAKQVIFEYIEIY